MPATENRRLVWMIQQTSKIGGTEMVSLNLFKALCRQYAYKGLLIVSGCKGDSPYEGLEDLDILYLDIPLEVLRFDAYLNKYRNTKQYFKIVRHFMKLLHYFVLNRHQYQKRIAKFTDPNDIIIASSLDSYLLAPAKRQIIFHFHFGAKDYFAYLFQQLLKYCIKPQMTVFLTPSCLLEVQSKDPSLKAKSVAIYNPNRFPRELHLPHQPLNILFVGRLEDQKYPELMVMTARKLRDYGFSFHLDVLGDGSKYDDIAQMIKDNELNDYVLMHGMVKDIKEYYRQADCLLVTSRSEGFSLTTLEANCFSLYVVSVDWGEGVHDVIKEGVNGTIVKAYDPDLLAKTIIQTFQNDYYALKKSAYDYAAQYDMENILPKWHELISSL